MGSVRQEIRYEKLQDTDTEEPEGQVTVRVFRNRSLAASRGRDRETYLRVLSSMLLLLVAVGFVLYELQVSRAEPPRGHNELLENKNELLESDDEEEEDESHHHSHHHDESDNHSDSTGHHHPTNTYHQGIAVTDSDVCSRIGKEMLQDGGTVVDAGIAAVLCLAVIHPHTTSLGAVFSCVVYNGSSNGARMLNALPRDPSPSPFGVPVMLQGLHLLHQNYGHKPWEELLSPAIRLANKGFCVDDTLGRALQNNQQFISSSVGLCNLFCHKNDSTGGLKEVGETVINPSLGKFLEQVSTHYTDSFVTGLLAQSLPDDTDSTIRDKFTAAISHHRPDIEAPVTLHVEELTLYTSGGQTAGRILSNFVQTLNENSSSDSLLLPLMSRRAAPVGTNVIIARSSGDLLVMSLSLNSSFGSGFVSPSTGILLSDFIQHPGLSQESQPEFWACPSVLSLEGDVMGLAATGGSSVPSSLAHIILNHLFLKMNLTESVRESLTHEHFPVKPTRDTNPLAALAVIVEAEHVHVAKSSALCCFHEGL
ncbi:glutathione hydrolase 6 [Xenopus laevis]|uniref:Glutathione hydrolase 6 n=2 Tax=Xenopus laevis TaxID=8355 RepID=A0A310UCY0_XENLA|nr:glutathione hydrolase 6 [Xenopus laevis]OCT56906.1 hypothetical protein XELAEV_18004211mg [Xenopus laevis]